MSPPYIKDVETATFLDEVIHRSKTVPVVVDFWATWCGPCRALGPVLEKEIEALGGRVELAKLDTDRNAELAAQFGIQGIPAVKAFKGGKVVDEFAGAIPAEQVRAFLAKLAPSPTLDAFAAAEEAWRAGKAAEVEEALRPLEADPAVGDRAKLLRARALLALGRQDEVPTLLQAIDPRSEPADAIPALERQVAFFADAKTYGGEERARAALAANSKDRGARWALAGALAARGATREALEELIEIVSRDRKFKDDGARLAMLDIFEQLGSDHELPQEFRRRLQIVL